MDLGAFEESVNHRPVHDYRPGHVVEDPAEVSGERFRARIDHLLDKSAFEKIKPTAFLVNTARGDVIDEKALVEALESGRLAGAGLDVYENEPQIPQQLLTMKNVVLLPHIGSATAEARNAMALLAVENAIDALSGRTPRNLV